jgi:hypothetical protein
MIDERDDAANVDRHVCVSYVDRNECQSAQWANLGFVFEPLDMTGSELDRVQRECQQEICYNLALAQNQCIGQSKYWNPLLKNGTGACEATIDWSTTPLVARKNECQNFGANWVLYPGYSWQDGRMDSAATCGDICSWDLSFQKRFSWETAKKPLLTPEQCSQQAFCDKPCLTCRSWSNRRVRGILYVIDK